MALSNQPMEAAPRNSNPSLQVYSPSHPLISFISHLSYRKMSFKGASLARKENINRGSTNLTNKHHMHQAHLCRGPPSLRNLTPQSTIQNHMNPIYQNPQGHTLASTRCFITQINRVVALTPTSPNPVLPIPALLPLPLLLTPTQVIPIQLSCPCLHGQLDRTQHYPRQPQLSNQ
jgi:hypothetical protein